MIIHAHPTGEDRALCGAIMPIKMVPADDFEQQIKVTCPTCRRELDGLALRRIDREVRRG